ncbi:MAG: hypothetical protein KC910_26905, partial [Candidatus Eremiobacteraeota bacterium]|nr:hypothetical protein [Candidatus Eremiobacteraeota bacterium]
LQSLESPIPAIRVHFRRPLGLEVVDRFLRALGGEHPELAAMRRRCPHLPVPVRMGKKELSHPIDCTTFKAVWHFRHSECRLWLEGRAEHHFERESPGLYSIFIGVGGPANGLVLQRNGLVYERPEVACKLPFVVVEAPYLPTDLSHLKLVDSSAFGRFRQDFEAIEAQVFEQIVEELADECRDQILRWAIERVKQVQKVACIPRLGSTSISWRAFLAEREVERYYTSRDWPHPPLPDDQIYVIAESNLEAVAHKVKLVCADERLEKARQWWNRHQQWLKLPTSPVALEVPCLTTTRTEIDDIHLLLGLHQVPTPGLFGSVLALRAQGRPLETLENELLPAGVVASINDPSLRMDADWAHVERDQTFSRVINNLHTLLPDLYRQALNQDPENDQLKVHLIYYAAFNLSPERWRDMPPWFYELKLFRLRNGRCLTLNQLQKKVYSRGLELDPGVWAKPAVDLLLKVIRR